MPYLAIALSRMTPVVVSSVDPRTLAATASGRSLANRARICRRTGIDRSDHSVRRFPSSARAMSLMSYLAIVVGALICSSGVRSAGGRQQILHAIGLFPGEKVDLLLLPVV